MGSSKNFNKPSFHCPKCKIYAKQEWWDCVSMSNVAKEIECNFFYNYREKIHDFQQTVIKDFLNSFWKSNENTLEGIIPDNFNISICQSCNRASFWVDGKMVYPKEILVEEPNPDLEKDISMLYREAALILADSPRGAAALLRLALQKLMVQIGEKGDNINDDIKKLVEKGLNHKIQKALDLVRFVGNNAVHPGQISFDDNNEIALKMFKLVNMIAVEMITNPKEIDNLYNSFIPEGTKKAIDKRDGKET